MEHSNRNIYVAGNFIAEQHVDIQILHADQVYTQPQQSATIKPKVIIAEDIPTTPKASASQKAKTKRTNAAVTEATFIYRHAPKHAARIVTLYQHLLKAQWIAPDTNPDDFSAIFEGNPSTARIKWIGKQAFLYYLIRQLVDLQLVSIPQNASVWQIVESHFLDKNSRPFHDFNKQKEPIKAKAAIDKLIEILQPSA